MGPNLFWIVALIVARAHKQLQVAIRKNIFEFTNNDLIIVLKTRNNV